MMTEGRHSMQDRTRDSAHSSPLTVEDGVTRSASGSVTGERGRQRQAQNRKVSNNLVALGSAAILSVFGVGYLHTQAAESNMVGSTTDRASGAAGSFTATIPPVETPAAAFGRSAWSPTSVPPVPTVVPLSPTGDTRTTTTSASSATPVQTSDARGTTATSSGPSVPVSTSVAAATPRLSATPTTVPPRPPFATPVAISTLAPVNASIVSQYKDGTYVGTGSSRHGSIEATVVIKGGAIVSASITRCGTRYPCSKISSLPPQVVAGQSSSFDLVSGATDSSRAYQGAVMSALATARTA